MTQYQPWINSKLGQPVFPCLPLSLGTSCLSEPCCDSFFIFVLPGTVLHSKAHDLCIRDDAVIAYHVHGNVRRKGLFGLTVPESITVAGLVTRAAR